MEKTWVSLNLEERENEQAADKKERLQRVNERLKRMGMEPVESIDDVDDEVLEVDPYLDETISVAFEFIDDVKLAQND